MASTALVSPSCNYLAFIGYMTGQYFTLLLDNHMRSGWPYEKWLASPAITNHSITYLWQVSIWGTCQG